MNWNPAIKWGIIGGLVSIILTMLIYFVSPSSLASFSLIFVFLLVSLFFLIWGGIDFRKANNDEISFVDALMATLIIAMISSLIGTLFSYILMNFIDPQLPEIIKQKVIENTVEMMEKFNTPDDKIEEAIDGIRSQNFSGGIKDYALKFANSMLMNAVFCLIVSAFIKRNTNKIKLPE
ncbi:MAG: DUF4199 domain-containing protein [Chitinophagales bacterium]|jgi:hypothetical protein|nr:DUF4199 domain-containing protein [Chitinophagales bacterium]